MARFNAAVMSGASDNKFQNIYNYLLDLLDQAYVVEKMINGKMSRVEISPEHGIVISYDGNNILSTDPLTGRLSLGSEGNLYIDTEDGIVIRSTIDGKESILQLNDTVGIAFFDDETYRGGLGVREDKLSLITDILGTVDDKYHFVEFDKHELYDSASETYSMLKFFASNNEATPAAIETFRMASRYWPTTDLAQTFLGTTINGTTVDAAELFLSSGMSLETPVGSAYLRLNASVASHTASIDLLAINTYENSCGFMIRANQTTPHIDVIVDYNIIGEWLSGGLKINSNYVWHAGNDGAGSGLDADTVDGVEADALVKQIASGGRDLTVSVANTTSYLVISSGLNTGNASVAFVFVDSSGNGVVTWIKQGSGSSNIVVSGNSMVCSCNNTVYWRVYKL